MPSSTHYGEKSTQAESADFEFHYQPLVSCGDRSVVGYEALLRLRDADGRLLYPAVFLPSLEATDLRLELGHWVIAQAMHFCGCLRSGFVTINLGARELAMPDLEGLLQRESDSNGIALDRIVLEITEEALPCVSSPVMEQMQRLRKLGVRIAIDDFGVGYSCLALLPKLPCDLVKLDRLFLHHASDNATGRRLFQSVTTLCREIGLPVVAEGVESEWQAQFAEECGCHGMQGYYLGRPAPLGDLAALCDFVLPPGTVPINYLLLAGSTP